MDEIPCSQPVSSTIEIIDGVRKSIENHVKALSSLNSTDTKYFKCCQSIKSNLLELECLEITVGDLRITKVGKFITKMERHLPVDLALVASRVNENWKKILHNYRQDFKKSLEKEKIVDRDKNQKNPKNSFVQPDLSSVQLRSNYLPQRKDNHQKGTAEQTDQSPQYKDKDIKTSNIVKKQTNGNISPNNGLENCQFNFYARENNEKKTPQNQRQRNDSNEVDQHVEELQTKSQNLQHNQEQQYQLQSQQNSNIGQIDSFVSKIANNFRKSFDNTIQRVHSVQKECVNILDTVDEMKATLNEFESNISKVLSEFLHQNPKTAYQNPNQVRQTSSDSSDDERHTYESTWNSSSIQPSNSTVIRNNSRELLTSSKSTHGSVSAKRKEVLSNVLNNNDVPLAKRKYNQINNSPRYNEGNKELNNLHNQHQHQERLPQTSSQATNPKKSVLSSSSVARRTANSALTLTLQKIMSEQSNNTCQFQNRRAEENNFNTSHSSDTRNTTPTRTHEHSEVNKTNTSTKKVRNPRDMKHNKNTNSQETSNIHSLSTASFPSHSNISSYDSDENLPPFQSQRKSENSCLPVAVEHIKKEIDERELTFENFNRNKNPTEPEENPEYQQSGNNQDKTKQKKHQQQQSDPSEPKTTGHHYFINNENPSSDLSSRVKIEMCRNAGNNQPDGNQNGDSGNCLDREQRDTRQNPCSSAQQEFDTSPEKFDDDGFKVPRLILSQSVVRNKDGVNDVIVKRVTNEGERNVNNDNEGRNKDGLSESDDELLSFSQQLDIEMIDIEKEEKEYYLKNKRSAWNEQCKRREGIQFAPLVKTKGRMKAAHRVSVGREVIHKIIKDRKRTQDVPSELKNNTKQIMKLNSENKFCNETKLN